MDKKIYYRGLIAQPWYNFTESLAYIITGRPIPEDVHYEKKLHYGKEKNQYMNLLCLEKNLNKKKPLFIYIHGGGWVSGITEMRNTYIMNWVNAGFFACSINYTYAPTKIFPAQLKEIYTALDFILDKAEEYNFDTENIVLAGESAGGYFISYIASCISDPSPLDKLGISFAHRDTFRLKAMVGHSGCYNLCHLSNPEKPQSKFPDMKMMLESFTGMSVKELGSYLKTPEGSLLTPQVNGGYPPCFLVWSTRDPLQFDTKDFVNELRKYNIPYRMFKADGSIGNHAWSIVTMLKKGKLCLEETFDFTLPYLPDYFAKPGNKWIFRHN